MPVRKTKSCATCRRRRRVSRWFTKNRAKKDGLGHSCKSCQRKYTKGHYERNEAYYKAKARRHRKSAHDRLQAVVVRAKGAPCEDCRQMYPHYVMDFDHVRGKKVADISEMVREQRPLVVVVAEIKKCEVVCANCHRERTHRRRCRLSKS